MHYFFYQVIGDFLSNEEVEDIKEMFKKIDSDNDGTVTIQELKIGLQKFGSQLGENEVQIFIEAVSPSIDPIIHPLNKNKCN